ncbi:MAG: SMR family transporter, partial [Chloroflexi bacterium]|nr:SMR family transporter [Chloroflexota bacterium]
LATGGPNLAPEGWLLAVASGVVGTAYFVVLSLAYRRGPLSAVYPVARGTGAVVAAVVGITVLGEQFSAAGLAGIALLIAGLLVIALPAASRAALVPALAAGVCIAGYTAIDRLGVRTGPAWLYNIAIWGFIAIGLALLTVRPRRLLGGRLARIPAAAPADDPATPRGLLKPLVAGLLMIGTYLLILAALAIAPMAAVAPLREASSVLAAGYGVARLGERQGGILRLVGATAIAVGAVLQAVSG